MSKQTADLNFKGADENPAENPEDGGSTTCKPPGGDRGLEGAEEVRTSRCSSAQLYAAEDDHNDEYDGAELLQNKPEDAANSTATVKVLLVPEGHVMTVAFTIGLSILELKRHLASELRVPAEVLQLSLDGRVVEEHQSLMELGVRPHSSMQMEMSSTDPNSHPLRPLCPAEQDSMPDVITVRVQKDDGVLTEVVIEIERSSYKKPWLGGYKHRLTGVEYHHAAVQTLPKKRPVRGVEVFSHQTQTVELKSQSQQCSVSASTQMTGIGCYVQCVNDRLVTPGKYITADEVHDRRLKAVICLQSFARRWLAQQAVERLRRQRRSRLAWLDMMEKRRQEEKDKQLRDRQRRWMNPQRREDFDLPYHALEKWRSEQEQQINSTLAGAPRKAALCLLLEQEMELITAIGRHHTDVRAKNHDKVIKDFLDKSAASHQWRAADGRLLEMDTPNSIRARELRDAYNNISMNSVSREQRLNFLTTLKHIVMVHDCELTRDIVGLIEREADLMARGVKARNLVGLRKRICTLFLQYIKTPVFNPNVAKLLKVPQNPSQLYKDLFRCRGCRRYLCSADISPAPGGFLGVLCKHCARTDNIARPREDLSLYRNILQKLRTQEQTLSKEPSILTLLQVEDILYLTEKVWESCSALSGSKDLYKLVFVRWEHQEDWSPWNCILLSNEETSTHLKIKDVNKVYSTTFTRWVGQKHKIAREYFSQIPTLAKYLESQPAAAVGNQFDSHHITMATGKHAPDNTSASSH
ncbi:IQ motif and ubiquitin-like domain-containing protein [Nothobranchius furzeri]|uniref:IQ motif and ubiquitin domain containing n=1 Tax=Nothobranchius furzeri TaxID=105023 RepID=A0A9D2Y6H6_NOTFU|nr:IQ and ubiquitin-like domain-containing protein [Nothobranchius furzeri]KAF7215114.1 IQ motif and ubiquitin domain containing [Nothobranchius furzeri]